MIYDFVPALSCAGISLEYASGELARFVRAYCPVVRTMPSAKWLRDSHLRDVYQHKGALIAKIGISVNGSPYVTGKLTVNVLLAYYHADHNTKAINLFSVTTVRALSATLNDCGSAGLMWEP